MTPKWSDGQLRERNCQGCGSYGAPRREYGGVFMRMCFQCDERFAAGFELGLAHGAATARRNGGLPALPDYAG